MDDTNRFALIEIDPDPAPVAPAKAAPKTPIGFQAPAPRPAPVRAAAVQAATVAAPPAPIGPMGTGAGMVGPGWGETGIDAEGADRAKAADAIATKAGLRFNEPTLFAWGTRMIDWGKKAHAQARAELNAQPLLSTLAADAAALVAKEDRRGDVCTLAQLAYGADDRLRTKAESPGVPVGVQALKQTMGRLEAPGGAYLADRRLPGELRAPHVTHWLDLHRTSEADARAAVEAERIQARMRGVPSAEIAKSFPMPDPKRVKLLSKLDKDGARTLYGVVGPKYPHTYGMDAVIRDVLKGMPGEVRGSLFYDASTTKWRVDAALGTEFTPVVGDVHRVGIKFGSHDAGGGSYWASLYAIRVRCVNFTQIRASKKLGRVKHVGTVEALRKRVGALLEVGQEAIREYSGLWAEANQTAIIADADAAGGDARHIFRALIEAGHLPAPDGKDEAVERYFNAWLVEPGQMRSDYINAATRAAHEAPWSNPWATDEIEEAAGQMLYQHVLVTPAQLEAVQQ